MWTILCIALYCVQRIQSSTVELSIHYPDEYIEPVKNGRVFSLLVCASEGCPANGIWDKGSYNQTVFTSNKVADNLYVKNVTLPNYKGNVWIEISAAENNSTGYYSVNKCVFLGGCNGLSVPYITNLPTTTSVSTVTAYPWFTILDGAVYNMFTHFYSPQLGNYRDISVYVPPSLYQNYLSREINVVIINDGSVELLQQFATLGGFDRAVQNGDLPQDTIMIGIGQNETSCQRTYELTYEECDPNLSLCPDCPTGGMFLYNRFIQETVVPAVLANLSMSLREVSMAGVSLGGLAACASASFQPDYFARAYCMSPSVWWNNGSLTQNITLNAYDKGLPTAVVMYMGTIEGTGTIAPPSSPTAAVTNAYEWFTFYNETVVTWAEVGMSRQNLFSFIYDSGRHVDSDWVSVFGSGMTVLFRSNFPANNRQTLARNLNFLYPTSPNSTCYDDPSDNYDVGMYYDMAIGVAVLTSLVILGNIIVIVWYLDSCIICCGMKNWIPTRYFVENLNESTVVQVGVGAPTLSAALNDSNEKFYMDNKRGKSGKGSAINPTSPGNDISKQSITAVSFTT
jgi:predicted alpha/beta superfamily hydrolase